jgi:hypothetical protein
MLVSISIFQMIINPLRCHTAVAPWFSPIYANGAYLAVHKSVGSLIDWYNIQVRCSNDITKQNLTSQQFYNRKITLVGTFHTAVNLVPTENEYTTCAGLLTTSSSKFPNSAVFQIAAAGVPLSKIVIGENKNTTDLWAVG